jgi:large subunit ribosomal protein L7/L12
MGMSKDDILTAIAEMSVMEVVELIDAMEEKFGVTAAAAVAAAPAAAGGDAGAAAEEQTEFDVVLTAAGEKKVNVIKVVRAVTVLASRKPRAWSTAHLPRSRKALPRTKQKTSRSSWKKPAAPWSSSKLDVGPGLCPGTERPVGFARRPFPA